MTMRNSFITRRRFKASTAPRCRRKHASTEAEEIATKSAKNAPQARQILLSATGVTKKGYSRKLDMENRLRSSFLPAQHARLESSAVFPADLDAVSRFGKERQSREGFLAPAEQPRCAGGASFRRQKPRPRRGRVHKKFRSWYLIVSQRYEVALGTTVEILGHSRYASHCCAVKEQVR